MPFSCSSLFPFPGMNGECGITVTAMSQITAFISDAEASATGAEFVGAGYPSVSADAPTSIIFGGQTALGSYVLLNAKLTESRVSTMMSQIRPHGLQVKHLLQISFGVDTTYTVFGVVAVIPDTGVKTVGQEDSRLAME